MTTGQFVSTLRLPTVTHHTAKLVDGVELFWRAAGSAHKPVLLLLHGFPSSSYQYRHLLPLLATRYRVLAPDYPNFGNSVAPNWYAFNFGSLARSIIHWLDVLEIKTFSVYMFDFGAPVAFRIATQRPKAIQAIISQNGNLYEEGLGKGWDMRKEWWATGDRKDSRYVEAARKALAAPPSSQYETGTPAERLSRLDPTSWTLDFKTNMQGKEDALLDLFFSYGDNVQLYPTWQEWLRDSKVPLLAVWGRHDPIFVEKGATAFKRDAPDARIVLIDGGHFLLETHLEEVFESCIDFLDHLNLTD